MRGRLFLLLLSTAQMCGRRAERGGSAYLLFWKQRLLISRNRSGGKLKAYSVHGRVEDDSCHQDSQKQSGGIRQE